MRLLKLSGYLFLLLLAATAVVLGLGSRIAQQHTATASGIVAASQDRVWSLISDVSAQPRWRTGLKSVERLPAAPGGPCWRELQSAMAMPLCVTRADPPNTRIVEIADPKLPFGGSWTYTLKPVGLASTEVTIREDGVTRPALWRFVGHYILGEDTQVKQYLTDLQRAAPGPLSM